MTKNEVMKQDEAYLDHLAGQDDDDDYTPAPSFPRLKIEIDKKTKDGKDSQFYILDDEVVTNLGKSIEVRPIYAQHTRALFKDGGDDLLCSSVNDIPTGEEVQAAHCSKCHAGRYKGECKPKVRLFCTVKVNDEWIAVVTNISTSSIKHWDKFKRRLDNNKPRALRYWWLTVEAALTHKVNGSFIWDEVEWSGETLTPKEDAAIIFDTRKQIKDYSGSVEGDDYAEPGDRPEYPPATGHVEEPQQKGTDSVDSEQSDLPF